MQGSTAGVTPSPVMPLGLVKQASPLTSKGGAYEQELHATPRRRTVANVRTAKAPARGRWLLVLRVCRFSAGHECVVADVDRVGARTPRFILGLVCTDVVSHQDLQQVYFHVAARVQA